MKVMGQYVYWSEEGAIYVGQSDNVIGRLKQHGDRFNHTLVWIFDRTTEYAGLSYEGVKAALRWDEACLIEQYNPIENERRPTPNSDWLERMPLDAQRLIMSRLPDLTEITTKG